MQGNKGPFVTTIVKEQTERKQEEYLLIIYTKN